jgi:hypothetical protein
MLWQMHNAVDTMFTFCARCLCAGPLAANGTIDKPRPVPCFRLLLLSPLFASVSKSEVEVWG